MLAKAGHQTLAGRPAAALETYERIVKRFPRTEAAGRAQLAIGKLYSENREYRNAFDAFQALIDHFPYSDCFAPALRGQLTVVERTLAKHKENERKGIKQSKKVLPKRSTIEEMLKTIIANGPYSEFSPRARYLLAVSLETSGDRAGAIEHHEILLDRHPKHDLADDATFQVALIHLKSNEVPVKDTNHWTESRTALLHLLTNYPDSDRAPIARRLLKKIEKDETTYLLKVARFYEKSRKPASALIYYQELARSYPDSPERQAILDGVARMAELVSSAASPRD